MSDKAENYSDVIGVLQMPSLAEFLKERDLHVQEIAVDKLLRYTSKRAVAGALKQTGKDVVAMAGQE